MQYEFVIPICGCGDASVPVTDNTTVLCKNATALSCVKNVTDHYDTYSIGTHCDGFCPLECDSNSYARSISTAYYPTNYYSGILSTQSNLKNKFTNGQARPFSPPTKTFNGRKRRDAQTIGLVAAPPPPSTTIATATTTNASSVAPSTSTSSASGSNIGTSTSTLAKTLGTSTSATNNVQGSTTATAFSTTTTSLLTTTTRSSTTTSLGKVVYNNKFLIQKSEAICVFKRDKILHK
jgi:hypothetical protein